MNNNHNERGAITVHNRRHARVTAKQQIILQNVLRFRCAGSSVTRKLSIVL